MYVSSAVPAIISHLSSVCAHTMHDVTLAHSFVDTSYNRTSFFLVGKGSQPSKVAMALCTHASQVIDFSKHTGTHPTLGAVDHICFSPLGSQALAGVGTIARTFARDLSTRLAIPTYTYGEASLSGARLQDIRRGLGYFSVPAETTMSVPVPRPATDFDCSAPNTTLGVVTVGAVPLVVNFNMRFRVQDRRKDVVQVAAGVRKKSLVESLTLAHDGGALEVACNLLDARTHGPNAVLCAATDAITRAGLDVHVTHSYCTGPSEEVLANCLAQDHS